MGLTEKIQRCTRCIDEGIASSDRLNASEKVYVKFDVEKTWKPIEVNVLLIAVERHICSNERGTKRGESFMEVQKIVADAWSKTVEDFRNAERNGETGLWTEASLRLNFIRHLNEVAKLGRILAETPFHFGNDDYKPDIIADVIVNNEPKRIVFEMKFYGQTENWKKDVEKLSKYFIMGWHYGYFLAIGYPQQCDEIRKKPIEKSPMTEYDIKILTEPINQLNVVPDFRFAEHVLRETLGKEVPYVANEIGMQGAFAFYEDYVIIFDMIGKENKLVVRAGFSDTMGENQKVKELGYPYIDFDEDGKIFPSETFSGDLLIGEFEFRGMKTKQVAENIREPLREFLRKMDSI